MKLCIYLSFLFLSLLSCESSKDKGISNNNNKDGLTINYKDSISISLDKNTSPNSMATFPLITKDTTFLLLFNRNDNSIRWFDLKSGNQVKKHVFEMEGPNSVGSLLGFFPISKDSVLITPMVGRVYLANSNGKIYNQFDYYKTNSNEPTTFSGSTNFGPIIFNNNKILLLQGVMADWSKMAVDKLKTQPLEVSIDMQSKKVEYLPYNYPGEIWKTGNVPLEFSRTWNGKNIVYSFYQSQDVFEYGSNDEKYKIHENTQSRNDQGIVPFKDSRVSIEEFCYKHGVYLGIVYDKYRKVYYRFYRPKLEQKEGVNPMTLIDNPPQFSISVLNEKFEKIGETEFTDNKFMAGCFFITEKGFYLGKVANDENILTFVSLELK